MSATTTNTIANWTVEEYEADTARLRSSNMKLLLSPQGPRGYYNSVKGLAPVEKSPGDHFEMGTLLHDYVLLGKVGWVVYDEKRGTNAWKAFKEEHPGLADIKGKDDKTLRGMRESVLANPDARTLIEQGQKELTFLWDDQETGIACKSRADVFLPSGGIADLKSWEPRGGQVSPESFFYHATRLGYLESAAFYEQGRDAVCGPINAPFWWIAVSKKPPYYCYVWPVDSMALETAHTNVRRALGSLSECLAADPNMNDPACWPDPCLQDQSLGWTPHDWWLNNRGYNYN